MERSFRGIWIPSEIWLSDDLGWTEKLLLAEIDSLSKNGECFASNEYFAGFFKLSKDRISRLISGLKTKGYCEVNIIYKPGTKQIEKRIITTIGYRRKQLEGIGENNDTPIGENTKDINTSFINTIINNNTSSIDDDFNAFWNLYNKKVDRKKSFDKYKKLRKVYSQEKIIKGTQDYLLYCKQQDQFIKNPLTFLNGENFNDDFEIVQATGGKQKMLGIGEE